MEGEGLRDDCFDILRLYRCVCVFVYCVALQGCALLYILFLYE